MTRPDPIPRRGFGRALAAAAMITPGALGDEPKAKDEKDKEGPKEPQKPLDEVEARMAILMARFGKHSQIDEKARAAIRGDVAAAVRRAETLRKFPLSNGDGPYPVFHPHRGPLVP
jgi:hypothetical protein